MLLGLSGSPRNLRQIMPRVPCAEASAALSQSQPVYDQDMYMLRQTGYNRYFMRPASGESLQLIGTWVG